MALALIENTKTDVDAKSNEGTAPIITAVAQLADLPIVQALVARRANLSATDKDGLAALHHGIRLDAKHPKRPFQECTLALIEGAKGAGGQLRAKEGQVATLPPEVH